MARLPTPGGDDGTWGAILNEYLSVNHDAGGFNAYQVAGGTVRRKLDDRLGEIKNVKDFGAKGDNATDDTAAIQRAVDYISAPYSSANRGIIFFPTGIYRVSAPITFEAGLCNIHFLGAAGAKLLGGFGDAMLKRSPFANGPIGGVHVVENLMFENTHASGKGVMLHSCVSGKIVNCNFGVTGTAIETYNSQCITIDTCAIIGSRIGVLAGNATSLIDCDITGCNEGVRHHNAGLGVYAGRFEVCNTAIRIGYDWNNNVFQTSCFSIQGPSMEANQTAIEVRAGAAGFIQFSCGSGVSVARGLYITGGQDILVAGTTVGSAQGFTDAGIVVEGGTRIAMMGVASPSWRVAAGINTAAWFATNRP